MAKRGSNYSGGEAYRKLNSARRMAKTSAEHRNPKSLSDYASIPHPKGSPWANRVRVVIGQVPVCWLCGNPIPRAEAVADHVIPLTEGQGLSIPTDSMDHPLNQRANLRPSHSSCNGWRGQLSPEAGRRKVADRLGMPAPYDGPLPDVSGVRAELSRLADQVPVGSSPARPEPPPTTESTWPYKTVAQAIADLENTRGKGDLAPGDLAEMWEHAGEMACECGPADLSACWICLPVPWTK